jgi:hypothetical protein
VLLRELQMTLMGWRAMLAAFHPSVLLCVCLLPTAAAVALLLLLAQG